MEGHNMAMPFILTIYIINVPIINIQQIANRGGCMFKIDGYLMGLMRWILRFLYLQFTWLAFSLMGIVILGFFPATFSMFGIARKWIREDKDIPIFSTFKDMFKRSFWKANLLGWFFVLYGYSLYFYFNWLNDLDGVFATVMLGALIVLGFISFLIAIYIIPVYVHFDVGILGAFKHATIMAISYPFHALGVILIILTSWYFFMFFTIIFLFIGISLTVFFIMVLINFAFLSIEKKTKQEE